LTDYYYLLSFKKEGFGVGLEQGRLSGYYDGYKTGAVQGAKLASEVRVTPYLLLIIKLN